MIESTDREWITQFQTVGIDLSPQRVHELKSRCATVEEAILFYVDLADDFAKEILDEMNGLGYKIDFIQSKALAKRCTSIENAIGYYIDNQSMFDLTEIKDVVKIDESKNFMSSEEYKKECKICFDEFSIENMYIVDCKMSHTVCYSCVGTHIKLAVCGSPSHIPACPLANGKDGCNYLLTEKEVCEINELVLKSPVLNVIHYEESIMIDSTIKNLYLSKAHRDNNHIECVGCKGDNANDSVWFSLPTPRTIYETHQEMKMDNNQSSYSADVDIDEIEIDIQPMRVECPRCYTGFCSQCKQTPYHYHCKCDEVMSYSRAWLDWISNGCDAYCKEIKTQQHQYKDELNKYNEKIMEHGKEVAAAEARFKELAETELWKAQHCKRCPNCQKIVEKLDGCDAMICGQNYHGGDVQNGCGKPFSWTGAPGYEADTGTKKTPTELDVLPPNEAQEVHHELAAGVPWQCDMCQSPIVGPRIQCIQCPDYNLCLQCSRTTVDRSNKYEEDFAFQVNNQHHNSHVCAVIFRNANH